MNGFGVEEEELDFEGDTFEEDTISVESEDALLIDDNAADVHNDDNNSRAVNNKNKNVQDSGTVAGSNKTCKTTSDGSPTAGASNSDVSPDNCPGETNLNSTNKKTELQLVTRTVEYNQANSTHAGRTQPTQHTLIGENGQAKPSMDYRPRLLAIRKRPGSSSPTGPPAKNRFWQKDDSGPDPSDPNSYPAEAIDLNDDEGVADEVVGLSNPVPVMNDSQFRPGEAGGIEVNPKELLKYWHQRYELFSKFDQGIRLDAESWYSVTPESIAIHIAERCETTGTIIDAFCGCGGNTIQFAKHCKKVVAIDIDPVKIEMAKHNARIYGVEDKINFVVADFMAIASVLRADIIFLSPPWGGPGYSKAKEFDLKTMIPMDGIKLFYVAQQVSQNIAYFVPKSTNFDQLIDLALSTRSGVDIEENVVNTRVKTVTAYYGRLATRPGMEGVGAAVGGTGKRIPGGPTQLRYAKEGSPELTTMIF